MKQKYLFPLAAALITALFFACSPVGPVSENEENERTEETLSVTGYVKSIKDNTPVSDAQVTLGETTVTTDSSGCYRFTVSQAAQSDIISVKKDGFTEYQNPVGEYSGDCIEYDFLIKPVDKTETINPAVGNTITGSGGAQVFFPAMSGFTENLVVSITNYDVSTTDIQAISGDYSAVDAAGNDTYLLSLGMINVDIKGESSGSYYSLAGKGPFTIRIPVSGDQDIAPLTIPLWYFDTATNKWREEGSATLMGSYYEGQVEHFTTWNADIAFDNGLNITGTIADSRHQFGDNYNVRITDNTGRTLLNRTGSDLYFTVWNLPINTTLTIRITNLRTGDVITRTCVTPGTPAVYYNTGTFFLGNDYGDTMWVLKTSPIPENWVIIAKTSTQYQLQYIGGAADRVTEWVLKESPLYPNWIIISQTSTQYQIQYVDELVNGDTMWILKDSPIPVNWVIIGQTGSQYQIKYVGDCGDETTEWVLKESPLYESWYIVAETSTQYQIKYFAWFQYNNTFWVLKESPITNECVIIAQTATQYQLKFIGQSEGGPSHGITEWVLKESPLYENWYIVAETSTQYQIQYFAWLEYGDTFWILKESPISDDCVIIAQTATQYQVKFIGRSEGGPAQGTTEWVLKESPLYENWYIIAETSTQYQIQYLPWLEYGDTFWIKKESPITNDCVIIAQTSTQYQLKFIGRSEGGPAQGTTEWVLKESPLYDSWYIIAQTSTQYQITYFPGLEYGVTLWILKESPIGSNWVIISETASQYQIMFVSCFYTNSGEQVWILKDERNTIPENWVIVSETATQFLIQNQYTGNDR